MFINCPFDAQYKPFFEAIVFAIFHCGFRPRCALEIDDSSIYRRFQLFEQELPAHCHGLRVHRDELTFNDSATIISDWIRDNP